jgi:hypothetical protein
MWGFCFPNFFFKYHKCMNIINLQKYRCQVIRIFLQKFLKFSKKIHFLYESWYFVYQDFFCILHKLSRYAETSMKVQILNNLFPNNRLFYFRDETIGMKTKFFWLQFKIWHIFLADFARNFFFSSLQLLKVTISMIYA